MCSSDLSLLLGMRLVEGIDASTIAADVLGALVADGMVERNGNRAVLTLRGRLLADAVVRRLLG